MNNENLHELIKRYKLDFEHINDPKHNEIFKWRAVKHFQNVWFAADANIKPFAELFRDAKKECGVLIDGARVTPANGIVKLAEQIPDEVENLFKNVLFADDGGNIITRQNNMESFLEATEILRKDLFPASWKYKQDRHAASCYLSLFAPEHNFIYRYSYADKFALYIDFGLDIGSGGSFRLDYYYDMCNLVVDALREHQDLLDMHFSIIDDKCYRDESLHIMAFDLIYCAQCYGYYSGLVQKAKKRSAKTRSNTKTQDINGKKLLYEKKRAEKIALLESQINELELRCEQYEDISLVNVEVFSSDYGKGLIIQQKDALVTVQFADSVKKFEINRKYIGRPILENDDEIVDALSEYSDALRKLKELRAELEMLS